MRHVLLVLLVACGDKTGGGDDTAAADDDTAATDDDTADPGEDDTGASGGGATVVWTTSLSALTRWNLASGEVRDFGQFGTVAVDGSGAYWYDGGSPVVADTTGQTWPCGGEPVFAHGGEVVYRSGGDTMISAFDGSGARTYALPDGLTGLYPLAGRYLAAPTSGALALYDLDTEPATQVFAAAVSGAFVNEVGMAADGTTFWADYSARQVTVLDPAGAVIATLAYADLGFGSESLYLSGFAGPGPDARSVRVYAEQGFSDYATGTLWADGTLTLDTLGQDQGLWTSTGRSTPDGTGFVAVSVDYGAPGVGLVDVASGERTAFVEGEHGAIGTIIDLVLFE